MGKIIMERKTEKGIIGATMAKVWRTSKPASFQEVGSNISMIILPDIAENKECGRGSRRYSIMPS